MINRNLRIVFMGTPEFAVPSLEILLDAGYPIVGVITAPDKPGGRGLKQIISSPVKLFAINRGLHVLQPSNLKSIKFIEELKSFKADLQVVVAFRMLPEMVWKMPSLGTMNLHGSLLPAYRGAAPIQWAIIKGAKKTGLTTFMLEHEIDKGQMIAQREIPILEEDDAGSLHDRMMHQGAGLVLGSVDQLQTGNANLLPQNDLHSSTAPKIHHEDARIRWEKPAPEIHNLIRGMSPFPGAWTMLDDIEWKILKAKPYSDEERSTIGSLIFEKKKLIAQAKGGELEILEIQMAGKKKMTTRDFLNGYKIKDWSMS